MDLSHAAPIGALADDNRRALYEYVVGEPDPVGREQAATAVGLPLHTASFHLDRLVTEGLLEVEFRRLTGRTGPGAGRPSKLYRPAEREFAVSLPPRRYDLVGDILAEAVSRAADGAPLERSLTSSAREEGLALGRAVVAVPDSATLPAVAEVLTGQGYQARLDDDVVTLRNCPFDDLARKHTELVCGLNRTFVQGVVEGMDRGDATACLEPEDGWCCVKVRPAG
ncbi:helix-turn-helix transcriptional regulator [Nocardioides sp.]|uniref:helix-turn-helix transcriptional regulator n=1 Tax=Nocardioides sp. TaxID=35761 RepID=UPI002ED29D39